ncbi:hypothetical protein KSP40_PGU019025 [Platanthera guangdongensis]|uniref:Uncharacterized protein n=1 Tax=Platanthera guangdongensis TaxID=2320717 RepID=A0ABR2LPX8_9ASPA
MIGTKTLVVDNNIVVGDDIGRGEGTTLVLMSNIDRGRQQSARRATISGTGKGSLPKTAQIHLLKLFSVNRKGVLHGEKPSYNAVGKHHPLHPPRRRPPFPSAPHLTLIDPDYPRMIAAIAAAGAGECWHKDMHLPRPPRRGPPHPQTLGRRRLRRPLRPPPFRLLQLLRRPHHLRPRERRARSSPLDRRRRAEKLVVHLFCVVPRQRLVHDDLLFRYSEEELAEHLEESAASIRRAREGGLRDESERWRVKMASVVPCDGIKVKDINTGEVWRCLAGRWRPFLLLTMATLATSFTHFRHGDFHH